MTLRTASVHPVTLISARIDGEITAGESRFLEAHLRSCASCQKVEAELRPLSDLINELPVASPPPKAIDRLIHRLRQPEEADVGVAEVQPARVTRRGRGRILAVWIPVLGALAIVGFVGVRERTEAPPEAPAAIALPTPTPRIVIESQPERVPEAPAAKPLAPPVLPPPVVVTVATPEVTPPAEPVPPPPPAVVAAAAPQESSPRPRPPAPIHFEGNSKRLTRDAKRSVEAVADLMREDGDVHLVIQAHTATRRTEEKTLELGRKRALAVSRYLEGLGIEPKRLRTVTYGDETASEATNDRIEFVLDR